MLNFSANSISPFSATSISPFYEMEQKEENFQSTITIDIDSRPVDPKDVVDSLVSIEGELDVYTWYEGKDVITKVGAEFLKEKLFEPLYNRKQDAKLWVYSLEAWNFRKNISVMNETTPKGVLINSINKTFVECIYASSFFKFCAQYNQETPLYCRLSEELLNKQYLIDLSAARSPKGKKINDLFEGKPSLVDRIKEEDLNKAYSILQFLEAYYLIREALIRGLEKQKQKIQVAFVLPNNEAKYYQGLTDDLAEMLKTEFGERLNGLDLKVYFKFYEYKPKIKDPQKYNPKSKNPQNSPRPYLGPCTKGANVRDSDIKNYFNYILSNQKV